MSLDPKDPDVAATYSIDWRRQLVQEARRGTEYAADAIVRPQRGTGFYYECVTAGLTAHDWPVWPRAAGDTVRDGSVVWEAVHPDDADVPTVQSAVWTVPDGLVKDSQAEDGSMTHITVSGGTDGEEYELTCRMTPTSGAAKDQSITIKVEHQ